MVMWWLKYLVLLIATALCITFSFANRTWIAVDLSPFSVVAEIPVFLLVLVCVIFGFLLGAAAFLWVHMQLLHRLYAGEKKIDALENALAVKRLEPNGTKQEKERSLAIFRHIG